MRFEQALAHVLASEGGYSDRPDDPGGATNYGITQVTYDEMRGYLGQPPRPVKEIEQAEVEHIYKQRYWFGAHCEELPEPLRLCHFDAAVNQGPGTAMRLLQAALDMPVDGHWDTETRYQAVTADPYRTLANYAALRCEKYASLKHGKPFLRGWLRRIGRVLEVA